jgi:hypothetical protein
LVVETDPTQNSRNLTMMGLNQAIKLFATFKPLFAATPDLAASNECADYPGVDEFKPSDHDWCYLRMYRCEQSDHPGKVANHDFGDVSWGITDAGPYQWLYDLHVWDCSSFGMYLHVYRLKVKKSVLDAEYSMCNKGRCGYPDPDTGLQKEGEVYHSGARRIPSVPGVGVKRQFSFPKKSEHKEWKFLCHERVLSIDSCLRPYTHGKSVHDAVVTFKSVALSGSPASGCESLSDVNMCTH